MFNQVLVTRQDRSALRFVWRRPGSAEPPKTYEMQVQVFGSVSSPTICKFVLLRAAKDSASEFPDAAARVQENFYVDNYLDSFDNENDACTVARDISKLLDRGGFRLTKWLSTSRRLLEDLPLDRRASPGLDLKRDALPTEKTLGLHWDAERDVFVIKTNRFPVELTQRVLLSAINSIYDPLGFIQPVVLKAKRILQKSQVDGIRWDDRLPQKLVERWIRWVDALSSLDDIAIPRCLKPCTTSSNAQIPTFCDASETGFGCVIYLRTENRDGVAVGFVAGKAWTSPKKFQTIPKLELQAAVMGLRLTSAVVKKLRLDVSAPIYWTESAIVLGLIQSTSFRFKTFVGHRIGEILESSDQSHVPSVLNPVDDASRGLHPIELNNRPSLHSSDSNKKSATPLNWKPSVRAGRSRKNQV